MHGRIAALALVPLLIASCGGKSDTTETSAAVTEPASAVASQPEKEKPRKPPVDIQPQGNELRLALRVGDEATYETATRTHSIVTVSGTGQKMETIADQSATQVVTVVAKDGPDMHIEFRNTKIESNVQGDENTKKALEQSVAQMRGVVLEGDYTPYAQASNLRLKTAPRGSSQSFTALVASAITAMEIGFLGLKYPEDQIRPGQQWSTTVDVGKSLLRGGLPVDSIEGGKLPMKFRVVSIAKSKDRRIAVLAITMSGKMTAHVTTQNGPATLTQTIESKGTAEIDMTTGLPLTIETQGTTVSQADAMTTEVRMDMKMRLADLKRKG